MASAAARQEVNNSRLGEHSKNNHRDLLVWIMPTDARTFLAIHDKCHCRLILLAFLLGLLAIACGNQKAVQCRQLFQIAQSVTESNKGINYAASGVKQQRWLKAANRFTLAADRVSALKIDQSQLIEYQARLATVYRIYSQATYNALKAKENKNLAALEDARTSAIKAGKTQYKLFREINEYCLEQ